MPSSRRPNPSGYFLSSSPNSRHLFFYKNEPITESIKDLTTLTTKLQVSSVGKDEDIIEVAEDTLAEEVELLRLDDFTKTSMVARVFARKGCTTSFLKRIFSRMWKFREPRKVRYLDNDPSSNYFGFSFASGSDFEWTMVHSGRPPGTGKRRTLTLYLFS